MLTHAAAAVLALLVSVISLCTVGLLFCLLMLRRNESVYRFRSKILRLSSMCSRGRLHPYEDMPDYDTMMLEFWKPLDSYLP